MFELLFYVLPSMIVIFALYLFFFSQPLKKLLHLDSRKPIVLVAMTYFILAFLGFILIFFGFGIARFIWLMAIIVLTALIIWVVYQLLRNKPQDPS